MTDTTVSPIECGREAKRGIESIAGDALLCLEEAAGESMDLIDLVVLAEGGGRECLIVKLERQVATLKVNARTLDWIDVLRRPFVENRVRQ